MWKFDSPLSSGSFKSEMWENADISFPSLQTPGAPLHLHPRLSLNLSFSFTLWMVHLAYMTERIHNPGQFKIPRGPAGVKMKPHKYKRLVLLLGCSLSCGWQRWPASWLCSTRLKSVKYTVRKCIAELIVKGLLSCNWQQPWRRCHMLKWCPCGGRKKDDGRYFKGKGANK